MERIWRKLSIIRSLIVALGVGASLGCSLDATIASSLGDANIISPIVGPTDIKPTAAISAPSVSSTAVGNSVTWTVVFSDFATENFSALP